MRFLRFILSITFFKQLAIIGLSSVLLFIFVSLSLTIYTKHNNYQIVPNFEGIQIVQLPPLMENENLRYEIIDSSFYNEEFDKNTVIEQIPIANKEVKKNRKIYLTTNPSSYGDVILPEIIQLTKRNAVTTLMALDLEIGEFIYENNIGKDMVLDAQFDGESIPPGSIIPKKSKIDLILGNGKKE